VTTDPVGTAPPDTDPHTEDGPGMRPVGSLIPPLLTFALGVAVVVISMSLPPGGLSADPGPGSLPRMVGIALILLSIYLLFKREPHERLPRGEGAVRLVLTLVLTLGYILTMRPLGFLTATAVFLAALMVVIGLRRPLVIIGLSILLSAGVYGLFRYGLEVPLPATRIGSVTL
jgi:putative tricarboxylic transport membrane protein